MWCSSVTHTKFLDQTYQTSHSYAMLSRCLGHLKKKGAVKLIWIISNGTKAPHYDKSIDNENVVELSYKQWRNVFSSQETIKTLMNWIHLNVLVSDSPPEPIDRPFTLREVQRVFYNEIDKLYEMYLTSTEKSMTKEQFKKLVVLCCGSGKTFLAYSIFTKSYRGNLLVVYVLELEKKYIRLSCLQEFEHHRYAPSLPLTWQHYQTFLSFLIRDAYHTSNFKYKQPILVGSDAVRNASQTRS